MGNHNVDVNEKPMLPPSVRTVEIQEDLRKPKLSMKYLHELILVLQHENRMLAVQLDELEHSMSEDRLVQYETAAAVEVAESESIPAPYSVQESGEGQPRIEMLITAVLEHNPAEMNAMHIAESESDSRIEASSQDNQSSPYDQPEIPKPILTPRSMRHPSRKRTFWSMFRFRTS